MQPPTAPNALTAEDLLGYSISDIECGMCSGAICGLRTPRIIENDVVMICPKTDGGRDVLRGYRSPINDGQTS